MIAELFYPKELKKNIDIFHKKGSLNNKSIKAINTYFNLNFMVFFGITIGIYSFWISSYFIIGGVLISTIFARNNMLSFLKNIVFSYSFGVIIDGRIENKYSTYIQGIYRVLYSFSYEGKNFSAEIMCDNNFEWQDIELGPENIFFDLNGAGGHAVFLPDLFNKCCLDSQRIAKFNR